MRERTHAGVARHGKHAAIVASGCGGIRAMAPIAITTVPSRQLLMPAINAATDRGLRNRFAWLHGMSVLVKLAHIVAAGAVLVRLA